MFLYRIMSKHSLPNQSSCVLSFANYALGTMDRMGQGNRLSMDTERIHSQRTSTTITCHRLLAIHLHSQIAQN